MTDHPCNLLGIKAGVYRMNDRANAGYGIIDFYMAVIIPRDCRDAVTFFDARSFHRIGELAHAFSAVSPSIGIIFAIGFA